MLSRTIKIGDGDNAPEYPVVFSTNAAFLLDVYLRQNHLGNVRDFMNRMIVGDFALLEVHLLFWAALEGGRKKEALAVKAPYRLTAWSIEEVGELIDKAGGIKPLAEPLLEILIAAKPLDRPADKGDAKNGGEAGQ